LKAIGEKLFPFLDHPWRQTSFNSWRRIAAARSIAPRLMMRLRFSTAPRRTSAYGFS
jgi:hypothetical protein